MLADQPADRMDLYIPLELKAGSTQTTKPEVQLHVANGHPSLTRLMTDAPEFV